MTGEPWTDEQKKLVGELWTAGLSASQIACRFKNRSRNAVIGIIHRGGLGTGVRIIPAKPKAEPRVQARVLGETRVKPAVVFGPIPATGPKAPFHGRAKAFMPLPGSQPKVWTERTFGECAWIVGGEGADVLACCEPAQGSWCATHHLIGHQKPTPGQPRTANELARSLRRYA